MTYIYIYHTKSNISKRHLTPALNQSRAAAIIAAVTPGAAASPCCKLTTHALCTWGTAGVFVAVTKNVDLFGILSMKETKYELRWGP